MWNARGCQIERLNSLLYTDARRDIAAACAFPAHAHTIESL